MHIVTQSVNFMFSHGACGISCRHIYEILPIQMLHDKSFRGNHIRHICCGWAICNKSIQKHGLLLFKEPVYQVNTTQRKLKTKAKTYRNHELTRQGKHFKGPHIKVKEFHFCVKLTNFFFPSSHDSYCGV